MDEAATFDSDALVNWLKYAFATVDQAEGQLYGINPRKSLEETAVAVETAIGHLASVSHVLRHLIGVQCAHCASDMGHYVDGRPISSHVRFGEGSEYTHTWHPDPKHSHNRPREVGEIRTRGGTRKRIVVSAPSHLDAYTVAEPERP